METVTSAEARPVVITDQWSDFLVRKHDPYAESKYAILLDWVGNVTGKTALIIGVGSGEFAAYLAQRGAKVLATDIDEEILKLARATAKSLNVHVDTEVARIETVSLERQYDLVCALDVLEHVEDDKMAIERLASLTKKQSGILLLTVPALQLVYGRHDEMLGHFRRYTKSTLQGLVGTRVRVDRMRYFGMMLIPVALVLSRILRKPYPVAETGKAAAGPSLTGSLVRMFFNAERAVSPPVGVSLLMQATVES